MKSIPRVAFFTDSFHEVNGVALTSREFDGFARRHGYPFLSIHTGSSPSGHADGDHRTIELPHSPLLVGLERDLSFDVLFWRYREAVRRQLEMFQPDLVHVTGPGHLGCLGAMLAHELRVPLVASWHTNVHEYAGRRLRKLLLRAPQSLRDAAAGFSERKSLDLIMRFYRLARLHFAPNPELVRLLAERTRRPGRLMLRGIDTDLFTPERRSRNDWDFVIGYVGRLSPEKNVRLLVELERELVQAGIENFRFLIAGDGSEWDYLAANLRHRAMPGVLTGAALSRAYANMDAFVFPSETDTFGNVVLEALACGVPAIVSGGGGPKFTVRHGVTGYVAHNAKEFLDAVLLLHRDPGLRLELGKNARNFACERSWDQVFRGVYDAYHEAFAAGAQDRSALLDQVA